MKIFEEQKVEKEKFLNVIINYIDELYFILLLRSSKTKLISKVLEKK